MSRTIKSFEARQLTAERRTADRERTLTRNAARTVKRELQGVTA